jgi:hypothetical protein
VFLLFSLVGFVIVDVGSGHQEGGFSNVINKVYHPPRTELVSRYDSETESMALETKHIPERWEINVNYNGEHVSIDSYPIFWNKVKDGDVLPVVTWIGGITGGCYNYRIQDVESGSL